MKLVIEKAKRRLTLWDGSTVIFQCSVALGKHPVGAKTREGDGKTPEGDYYICLVKPEGKYGRSLGLSYPSQADGEAGFCAGLIDGETLAAIRLAQRERRRPPWGTALGGEIYLHEGGVETDWTQGCIALESVCMERLFFYRDQIEIVNIFP